MHHMTLIGCVCFPQQRNLQQSRTPSRHVSVPVAPPQTPPPPPRPPPHQTQASPTLAERQRISMWEAHARDARRLASYRVDWTAVELLMTEPQDGSDETSSRQNWSDSTSVKAREKEEWGFPCAQLIHPILSWTQKSWWWMERRRLIVKPLSGELALLSRARDAPSPASNWEEWSMCWRDKGARARICLISGENVPSSHALCLYAV